MTETVELMMIAEIRKNAVFSIQDVIRIKVSILLLGGAYDVDCAIRDGFQLRIWVLSQGITNCLDPFIKITVLENEAIKFVVEMLRILQKLGAAPST